MNRSELSFERPARLEATRPPERRGLARDEVRLLVSTPAGHRHADFLDLPHFLRAGDLLVVNQSATLPASLPAEGAVGPFTLNLSTSYGRGIWLAEPRWSPGRPGPLPLCIGDRLSVAGLDAWLLAPYPGLPRLWFLQAEGDLAAAMARRGEPIRYAHVAERVPLADYQTLFATTPGSAEMPSAGRPFTARVLDGLRRGGVALTGIVLHAGVSSHEVETDEVADQPLFPEPFAVNEATARAVNAARQAGRRVVAVGTTVVRALESAWDGTRVVARAGFTRLFVHPGRGVHVVDGLLTGLHDPVSSHLAMLHALAPAESIRSAYAEAVREGYLWHEFGDSHLILRR
jgi:S-adenosylmethionine:tRNA ribosyltransferase-isomerase